MRSVQEIGSNNLKGRALIDDLSAKHEGRRGWDMSLSRVVQSHGVIYSALTQEGIAIKDLPELKGEEVNHLKLFNRGISEQDRQEIRDGKPIAIDIRGTVHRTGDSNGYL